MSTFPILLFLTTILEINANTINIQVASGAKATLECSSQPTTRCTLTRHSSIILDRHGSTKEKFKIRDSDTCVVEIQNITFEDIGNYKCIHGNSSPSFVDFNLTVIVRPEIHFLYNGRAIQNNTVEMIYPEKHPFFQFECRASQGYPCATFSWYVNGILQVSAEYTSAEINKLCDSRSTLILYSYDLIDGKDEKLFKCLIHQPTYVGNGSEILQGIFIKANGTNRVKVVDKSGKSDRILQPGETREIICVANGFPNDTDFRIKKWKETDEWTVVNRGASYNVTEPGVYVCELMENGLVGPGNFSQSEKIEFSLFNTEDPIPKVPSSAVSFHLTWAILMGLLLALIKDL